MRKIIIVVRSNTDWKRMTIERLFQDNPHFDRLKAKATEIQKYKDYIEVWNDKFNISFFEFRHEIKLLSEKNWCNLESIYAIIKDANLARKLIDKIGHCIILPTDDDDWYHPNLTAEIDQIKFNSLTWPIAVHSSNLNHVFVRKDDYLTNNYAISKPGWNTLTDKRKSLVKHVLDRKLFSSSGIQIDSCLSAWNRNMTSFSWIRRWKEKGIEALERKVKFNTRRKSMLPEAAWIEPFANQMTKLYQELL